MEKLNRLSKALIDSNNKAAAEKPEKPKEKPKGKLSLVDRVLGKKG
jgi:hypothetical protein